ncbi:uncharacterized protein DEA37_0010649, partial [Paragonimus westermani]
MEDVRFRRLVNEITLFLQQEIQPVPKLSTGSPLTDKDLCDFALCTFSCLETVPSRLSLLDRLLRRKSSSSIYSEGEYKVINPYVHYAQAFCRLAVELANFERSFVQDDTSSTVHLCLCLQLMSLCLSRSTQSEKLTTALEDLFSSFNSLLSIFLSFVMQFLHLARNSFDCMTAGFTLLVNVLRYYTDWNFDEFVACCAQPVQGLCDSVSNLVDQVTELPWFTRGTLAVLQRLVLVLYEGAGFPITWLLSRLALTFSNGDSIEEQCTVVVSNLMKCVSDPSLYAH